MIIDDEVSFTDMLGRLLQEHFHCPIHTFSNPVTALESMTRLKVGIVVTDYYMPGIDGPDLIRRISETMPNPPPCLLVTGHTLDEDSAIHTFPCYKGIIAKPFRWQQLDAQIVKHRPQGILLPVRPGAASL